MDQKFKAKPVGERMGEADRVGDPCQSSLRMYPVEQNVSVFPVAVVPGNVSADVLAEDMPVPGGKLVAVQIFKHRIFFLKLFQNGKAGDRIVVGQGKSCDPVGYQPGDQLRNAHAPVRFQTVIMKLDSFQHIRSAPFFHAPPVRRKSPAPREALPPGPRRNL